MHKTEQSQRDILKEENDDLKITKYNVQAQKDKLQYKISRYFWNRIQEDLSIYKVFPRSPKHKVGLYEINDEDLIINETSAYKWSTDNHQVVNELKQTGYNKEICSKEYLLGKYVNINFANCNIVELDPELTQFSKLEILNLVDNQIAVIENLPPRAEEVLLYSNSISAISFSLRAQNLLFLALGYNRLQDNQLELFARAFPKLRTLDLSFNLLCEIDVTVQSLVQMQTIRMLSLKGNPISLLPGYAIGVPKELAFLEYYDGQLVETTEKDLQNNNNALKKRQSTVGSSPPRNQHAKHQFEKFDKKTEKMDIQFPASSAIMNLKLEILTLENPDGVLLDGAQYGEEYEKSPASFQSVYWATLEVFGIQLSTKDHLAIMEQLSQDENPPRIDFQYCFSEFFKVSEPIRDSIRDGIIVKFHVRQPKMEFNEEKDEKLPVFLEGQKTPVLEEKVLGICFIQLNSWLQQSLLPKNKENKYVIFPENSISIPELFYPFADEMALLRKFQINQEKLEAEKDKQEQLLAAAAQAEAKTKKEEKKAPPKTLPVKDLKKAQADKGKAVKKGGKDIVEQVKKEIPYLKWDVERSKIYVNETKVISPLQQYLVAIKLELNPQ